MTPWDSDKSTASDPDNPTASEQLTADEWDAHVNEGHFPSDELQLGVNGSGDPVFTDPQNGDAEVLRYDRDGGAWVVPALETDSATVNQFSGLSVAGRQSEEHWSRVGRQTPSTDTGTIQFTGLSGDKEYRLWYTARASGGDIYIRLNGDGASTGNYFYWNETGAQQTGQDQFLAVSLSGGCFFSGSIHVTRTRYGVVNRTGINHSFMPGGPVGSITTFGREGGRDVTENPSSIEFIADQDFIGGDSMFELWERDYA